MSTPQAVDAVEPDGAGAPANVADLLRSAATRYAERPAVIDATVTRTWSELDRAADAGAARLRSLGVGAGERVVIALPTGAELAAALFAVVRAGLIAVPTGPGADVAALADRVGGVASIGTERDRRLGTALAAGDVARWWDAGPEPFESVGGGEDLALLARARGDRAVMLSHRAIRAAVDAIGRLGEPRMRDGDRVLQVLPLYHVAGWVVSFLPNALVGGAAVIPEVGFDVAMVAVGVPGGTGPAGGAAGRAATESAVRAAVEHAVTVIPGAPGFYHRLMSMGADGSLPDNLSSVRVFTSGNAPLSAADFAAARDRFGRPVWEGYGISESASVVTSSLTTGAPARGSVGRPLSGIELRVVGPDGQDLTPTGTPDNDEPVPDSPDPDHHPDSHPDHEPHHDPDHDPLDTVADAPDAGEVGRIVIRGATLFSGYWPNGGGGPDADGWFVTGDIGFLDDAGELHLVDRAAEVIVVAGFTVYPREIEDVLAAHPDVAEVAVIGVPASDGHEELAAVLVRSDGTGVDDLREFVIGRLPEFKQPAVYHLVDALPTTEVGRVDRDAVRRRFGTAAAQSLPTLAAVPDAGDAGGDEAEPDVAPEPVGDLAELGIRLPGTGDRSDRARDDTDEDLF